MFVCTYENASERACCTYKYECLQGPRIELSVCSELWLSINKTQTICVHGDANGDHSPSLRHVHASQRFLQYLSKFIRTPLSLFRRDCRANRCNARAHMLRNRMCVDRLSLLGIECSRATFAAAAAACDKCPRASHKV